MHGRRQRRACRGVNSEERRYGGSWQEGGARAASPPLQGLAPPARRPSAAGAPWEARARAARVQTAGEDLVVVVVVVHTPTPRITSGRLPLIGGSIPSPNPNRRTRRPGLTSHRRCRRRHPSSKLDGSGRLGTARDGSGRLAGPLGTARDRSGPLGTARDRSGPLGTEDW